MRVARMLAVVSALAVMTGCSSGPSLEDAAAELQKDTQRLETDDVFKNPLSKLNILERPDKDIPCGNGKFRRILRATADYERKAPDVDGHLDLAQTLMENTLAQLFGYKLEYDFSQTDKEDGRLIRGEKKDLGITVTVDVLPDSPTWRLRSETPCLSRG
ncbi:hypothetical protein ACFFMN_26440 [Planobispora siamensis]|uniref:Lipoprotein n=1 Tax=Planobispora siamensis TaxID=936338 RepID=A0A8J3SCS0_9ACTN|nr:hypothetical protein [Planobispora siamensis]GIH90795.1 hypothetical protein Psi01_14250 [Planobispora siamensis]